MVAETELSAASTKVSSDVVKLMPSRQDELLKNDMSTGKTVSSPKPRVPGANTIVASKASAAGRRRGCRSLYAVDVLLDERLRPGVSGVHSGPGGRRVGEGGAGGRLPDQGEPVGASLRAHRAVWDAAIAALKSPSTSVLPRAIWLIESRPPAGRRSGLSRLEVSSEK